MSTIRSGEVYRIGGKNYRAYVYTYSHTLDHDGVYCINCNSHKDTLGADCKIPAVRLEKEEV